MYLIVEWKKNSTIFSGYSFISKDCVRNDTKHIYFCSHGLKRANKVELNITNDNFIQWDYTNDYCCIKNIKK